MTMARLSSTNGQFPHMKILSTFSKTFSKVSSFLLGGIRIIGSQHLEENIIKVKTFKDVSFLIRLIMLDTNFPGKKKQPDSAFVPNPRPNPNNLLGNLVQLQPILGLPWPTIVLEVGNSEPVSKLIEHRSKYLGHTTQVNVYVGVSYNRNASRQTDLWWMCVAHRDIHAPQPPPGIPPEYPAPIMVGELQKTAGNRYPLSISQFPQTLPPGQYPLIFYFFRSPFLS